MAPRSIDELVAHQVRRWELEQRAATVRPQAPCIAMSRLPHSGAAELGLRAAEKLDFGFFGIEIVEQIADESGIQPQLLTGLDEHVRSGIDRYVADAFRSGAVTESTYLRQLMHVLATLGARGGAVILGRGSPFVLRPERTLRVLVTAPAEFRARRLAKAQNLEEGLLTTRALTMPAQLSILLLVFTPRWISREASNGVLFFWGSEHAD